MQQQLQSTILREIIINITLLNCHKLLNVILPSSLVTATL